MEGVLPPHFVVKLNEAPVPYVDTVKYLGVFFFLSVRMICLKIEMAKGIQIIAVPNINVKNFNGSLTTVVRAQNDTSKTANITFDTSLDTRTGTPLTGASNAGGVGKNAILDEYLASLHIGLQCCQPYES